MQLKIEILNTAISLFVNISNFNEKIPYFIA